MYMYVCGICVMGVYMGYACLYTYVYVSVYRQKCYSEVSAAYNNNMLFVYTAYRHIASIRMNITCKPVLIPYNA